MFDKHIIYITYKNPRIIKQYSGIKVLAQKLTTKFTVSVLFSIVKGRGESITITRTSDSFCRNKGKKKESALLSRYARGRIFISRRWSKHWLIREWVDFSLLFFFYYSKIIKKFFIGSERLWYADRIDIVMNFLNFCHRSSISWFYIANRYDIITIPENLKSYLWIMLIFYKIVFPRCFSWELHFLW